MTAHRVLVIDDDAAVRTLFEALLTRAGCAVDFAADGNDGLAKIDGHGNGHGDGDGAYTAIILDLMMPQLSGLQVLERLASRPDVLQKIIVTTGASRTYLEKIDRSHVHAVIRKPFDINVLLNAVLSCGDGGNA